LALEAQSHSRALLLLHDGELEDVRELAARLGAGVVEVAVGSDEDPEFDVAVTTPRHLGALGRARRRPRAVRVAVIEHDTRTLRAMLRRAGVDLVVRRPVHPAALRLLLLHALYRGPERRTRRVAVGAPVRFRDLVYSRGAILADLSERGCLLLARRPARLGRRIRVYFPDPSSAGREFAVAGRVVRAASRATEGADGTAFGVEFERPAPRVAERLREAVAAHLEGPAVLPRAPAARAARTHPTDPLPAPAAAAEGASGAPEPDPLDRRQLPRGSYEGRRVVALGEEAARVLIGRDLSPGGMRVDPTPRLRIGQRFRLALHVSPGDAPLVVPGEVERDDGPQGLVLRFHDLGEPALRYLTKMVHALPVLEMSAASQERIVVSELLDDEG
jgi:hypothetical protein